MKKKNKLIILLILLIFILTSILLFFYYNNQYKIEQYKSEISSNLLFDKILFFHEHVNGDCFQSRVLVNHIINQTKDLNIEYYYTSPRALSSHSLDINIKNENFNKYEIINNSPCYIDNNILYINIWIGLYNDINSICVFCLKNIISNNNLLIMEINKISNLNINYINKKICPYLKYNYEYYDCNFLNEYINEMKQKYLKIILIIDNNPTTFSNLNINHSFYLKKLSKKYKNYLFITFTERNLNIENIISIENIYKLHNKELPTGFGIQFSYLSFLVNKVILLPSGCSLFCFNDDNIENKYLMLFNNNLEYTTYCNNYNDNILCSKNIGWKVKILNIDFNKFSKDYITRNIENFIIN